IADIVPTVINSVNGGPTAIVTLRRSITPVTDFHIDFDFAWDSKTAAGVDSVRAMQSAELRLYDAGGNTIGRANMSDGWVAFSGSRYVGFGNDATNTGLGSAPLSAVATVDIDRVGNVVEAD